MGVDINEKNSKNTINKNSLAKKILQKCSSIFIDVICACLILFSLLISFSVLNSKIQNTCPTFAGYSNMTVVSSSMVASGFDVGDTIIIRKVDTDTLNVGDKIAFYVYPESYKSFNIYDCTKDEETKETKYAPITIQSIFGFQTDSIKTASQAGSNIVFHHIAEIYKDANGNRWFVTRGSSNTVNDTWYISEDMVVGIYDDSEFASIISYVLTNILFGNGVFILVIPIVILSISVIFTLIKRMKKVAMESDTEEENQKMNDSIICDKNDNSDKGDHEESTKSN